MVEATTIKLHKKTKKHLDKYREYKNESYDEVIKKLLFIAEHADDEDDLELSKETVEAIKKARERMKKGHYYTLEEAKKRLGL